MDAQALFNEFFNSEHGQAAMGALAAQGIPADQAQQALQVAAEAAHEHVEHHAGLLGEHAGRSFFAAFASGIVKGDGIWGSMKDGLEGMLGARVTEAVGDKLGFDTSTAQTIAAAATPFLKQFLENKLTR